METKILSPVGKLLVVEKIVPIIEKKFNFNGENRFLGEVCKKGVKPNGMAIKYRGAERFAPACDELIIGNISCDKVDEIMQCLLIQGYFDFTKMSFQKAKFPNDVIIDNGVSDAYTNEITAGICKMYNTHAFSPSVFAVDPFNGIENLGADESEDGEYDEE